MPKKIEKQAVKSGKTSGEAFKTHGSCKFCSWILPLLVIILVWWKPAETWAQITITVIAVLVILGHLCPCHRR